MARGRSPRPPGPSRLSPVHGGRAVGAQPQCASPDRSPNRRGGDCMTRVSPRQWLSDQLMNAAAARVRRRHPEWAQAMVNEHASLSGDKDQLGWALGSFRASLHLQEDGFYPALLLAAVA